MKAIAVNGSPRKGWNTWILSNKALEGAKSKGADVEMVHLNMVSGRAESLMSYDTYQFEDYSKVVADGIDESKKKKRREEIFPVDCENSFNLGVKLIEEQMRLQQDILILSKDCKKALRTRAAF